MAGAISGSRVTLLTVALAIAITAGFHWLYADVAITAGLQLEFVVVAFFVALGIEWIIRALRRAPRATSAPATPAENKDRP